MRKYFLLLVFFTFCSKHSIDLKEPINLNDNDFEKVLNTIFLHIEKNNYTKLYDELFSGQLREKKTLDEFSNELDVFKKKYGKLMAELSAIKGITWETNPPIIKIKFFLEYEKRTIFATFLFTRSNKNRKLEGYTFYEN